MGQWCENEVNECFLWLAKNKYGLSYQPSYGGVDGVVKSPKLEGVHLRERFERPGMSDNVGFRTHSNRCFFFLSFFFFFIFFFFFCCEIGNDFQP